jgi:hypothetical protein
MKRALVVVAAVSSVLGVAPAAHASTGAPRPTVTIRTTVGGQALPTATMTGGWTVKQPGRAATLTVNGVLATGTVTTIRSTWVSSMRRSRGLQFYCEMDYDTAAPGSANNAVTIHVQYRTTHDRWQESGQGRFSHTSQPLDDGGEGAGAEIGFLHPVTIQWRVQMTATFDDTSRQTFQERVKSL